MKSVFRIFTALARHPFVPLSVLLIPVVSGCGRDGEFDMERTTCFDVAAADGKIHLLYGVSDEGGVNAITLHYARTDDDGETWSTPVRIPVEHAPPGRHDRGNDPQLAVAGDHLLALWTAQGEGPWGSGPLGAAVSSDGGSTWQAAPVPAGGRQNPALAAADACCKPDAETAAGFRFPATAADREGFHAVWIHAVDDERSLRYARLDFDAAQWSDTLVIDPHICACCWNRLAVDDAGNIFVLYRDRQPSDMALASSADRGETWEVRGHVGIFDWRFEGCPHVGGGLVAGPAEDGRAPALLASVWTGESEQQGSHVLRSENGGSEWEKTPGIPARKGRNTDIALARGSRAVAVWDEADGSDPQSVFAAISTDAGRSWSDPVRVSETGRFATHPRAVNSNGRFVVFWTGEEPGIRMSGLAVRDLSPEILSNR